MAALRVRSRRTRRLWLTGVTLTALALFVVVFVAASSANLRAARSRATTATSSSTRPGTTTGTTRPTCQSGRTSRPGRATTRSGRARRRTTSTSRSSAARSRTARPTSARFAVAGETVGTDSFLYLAWTRENARAARSTSTSRSTLQAQPDLTTPGAEDAGPHGRRPADQLRASRAGSNTAALTFRKWTGTAWGDGDADLSACSEGPANTATVSEPRRHPTRHRPAQSVRRGGDQPRLCRRDPAGTCAPFSSRT